MKVGNLCMEFVDEKTIIPKTKTKTTKKRNKT